MKKIIYTLGYGKWGCPVRMQKMIAALHSAEVNLLVDIRQSATASNPGNSGNDRYGPRDWHVQAGTGIKPILATNGIRYQWISELGNPQKKDPAMAILRDHIQDQDGGWPVHRGLELLKALFGAEENSICLMCACKGPHEACHRSVVAAAFAESLEEEIGIVNLSK